MGTEHNLKKIVAAYGSVGVNSGSSSVKTGSKLSQSFSKGGWNGGITCFDSN